MLIRAPAKVNLRLEILGKRDDGYHEILSLIQPVSLFDEVKISTMEGRKKITVRCSDPSVPSDDANIAFKAAELLMKRCGISLNVNIEIEKKIPIAAGLGGGSSDAAATISGLVELLKLDWSEVEKMEIASEIGADVPFFLLGSPAIAKGRGELLEKVQWLPPLFYVLIYPGFGVSTRWAYSFIDLSSVNRTSSFNPEKAKNLASLRPEMLLQNDLEGAVAARYPVINYMKDLLMEAGARGASMTGSGSSVFGLFTSEIIARQAADNIQQQAPAQWKIYLVKGL